MPKLDEIKSRLQANGVPIEEVQAWEKAAEDTFMRILDQRPKPLEYFQSLNQELELAEGAQGDIEALVEEVRTNVLARFAEDEVDERFNFGGPLQERRY